MKITLSHALEGYRKLILGLLFLVLTYLLAVRAMNSGADLLGTASIIAAMAAGVLTIVQGNVQEHRTKNGTPK